MILFQLCIKLLFCFNFELHYDIIQLLINILILVLFQGVCEQDCKSIPPSVPNYDKGLNTKFAPGYSDFLNDVKKEKSAIG